MSESSRKTEKDVNRLRHEYNAAVANGLVMQAKRIERRLNALLRLPPVLTSAEEFDRG